MSVRKFLISRSIFMPTFSWRKELIYMLNFNNKKLLTEMYISEEKVGILINFTVLTEVA